MSNGRQWTADDTAQLRRLLASGRTFTDIGGIMDRHERLLRQKAKADNLEPGTSRILNAMMMRLNARRLWRRAARA